MSQLIMKRNIVTPVRPSKRSRYQGKTYGKKSSRTDLYKIVQNVLSRSVETETTSHTLTLTNINSGIDNSGDVHRLLPIIAQGSDDGQRKGSVICAKSLNVRGHIQLTGIPEIAYNDYSFSPNSRIGVRLMVVTPKRFPTSEQASANASTWLPNLLRNGVITKGFSGTVQDLYLPLNLDEVTVHLDNVHDLSSDIIRGVQGSTSSIVVGNNKETYAFFNFNIPCKNKKITFVDETASSSNYGPVLIIGYSHMNNSSPDIIQTAVQFSYVSTLKYTDL